MLYILFFFISTFSIWSVDTPKEPSFPSLPDPTKDTETKPKSNSNGKKEKKKATLNVSLCDGREVTGQMEYDKDELSIKHVKDGIFYEKTLSFDNIKKVQIQTWEPIKQKKVKDGTTYKMEPKDLLITTRDGEKYKIRGILSPEFSKLSLKNRNGTAILYSYWIDLKYDNGQWYTGLSAFKADAREDCHNDIIRSFLFYPDE